MMAKSTSKFFKITMGACLLAFSIMIPAYADIIDIRSDAPEIYVVKKGDTLWDISNIFLDKPWLWPELWRNNTQIENPHLIYPGDTLRLRWENGVPVLEVVREKSSVVLTPQKSIFQKPAPIDVLPWELIRPFMSDDRMMSISDYNSLPSVYGDRMGTPMLVQNDYVLSQKLVGGSDLYDVVRSQNEVVDSEGNSLGYHVTKVGGAKLRLNTINDNQIIEVIQSDLEARQGDKVLPKTVFENKDMIIQPAEEQRGELVQNINGNGLMGRMDIVIINLGEETVSPGTVFGIYEKGKDLRYTKSSDDKPAKSRISELIGFAEIIEQPAYKVGELIVVRTFEQGSYAFVTKANSHLKGGEIIATP